MSDTIPSLNKLSTNSSKRFFDRFSEKLADRVGEKLADRAPRSIEIKNEQMERVYLGSGRLACKQQFGRYLIAPTINWDVAIGIMRDGMIEPHVTNSVKRILKRGDHAINVGANLGYYSVLAATIVEASGKVVAIEANPWLSSLIAESLYWSGTINNVELYNCACADQDGIEMQFSFDPRYAGGGHEDLPNKTSSMVKDLPEDQDMIRYHLSDVTNWFDSSTSKFMTDMVGFPRFQYTCIGRTLASIVSTSSINLSNLALIVMDIEGSEPFVINSSGDFLGKSANPTILMEWIPENAKLRSPEPYVEMFKNLEAWGYNLFSLSTLAIHINELMLHQHSNLNTLFSPPSHELLALRKDIDPTSLGFNVTQIT